ncbi:MAG TPA: hypothetical protein ENJ93_02290 [Chloroflexi bacterium]|nr:hypothetical protein [Chloroflexota bacterium]
MNVGMLWLDDDRQRPLEEKVSRAADYYREKYGRLPELCLVNPKMLAEEKNVGRVRVQPKNSVLLHHFWLGMNV